MAAGEGSRHRLRDLLLGNPHNPGWLQQKLILHFTPDRCSPVYGEAATLGQLRQGLRRQHANQALGQFILRRAVLTMKQVERKLRGHRYKEPAFVESDILQDPEFRQDLEKIGARAAKRRETWTKRPAPTSRSWYPPRPHGAGPADSPEPLCVHPRL